jgi:hypothetical protein
MCSRCRTDVIQTVPASFIALLNISDPAVIIRAGSGLWQVTEGLQSEHDLGS